MFGFHWAELVVILVIATIIFGPKRIPEIGGALGKGIRDFRKGVAEIQEETGVNELRNLPTEVASEVRKAASAPAQPQPHTGQEATGTGGPPHSTPTVSSS